MESFIVLEKNGTTHINAHTVFLFVGTKPEEFPWEKVLEFSSTLNWTERNTTLDY